MVSFYRRPMQKILSDTVQHFAIERFVEPQPTERFKEQKADAYQRLMTNPHFLIVQARKASM